jgi:hypothetical protein
MMIEAQLGRLLPACLHQAIADLLPDRLEYYEEWLSPDGLRDGTIGLAPVSAVVGFLRTEGPAYQQVMTRAGELAAAWSLAGRPALHIRIASSMPLGVRTRLALRAARQIAQAVLASSEPSARVRRGHATLRLKTSVFCLSREKQSRPLCDFYAALAVATLASFQVKATATIESCRAMAGPACVIALDIVGAGRSAEPAIAA